jgi:hypothetical protein
VISLLIYLLIICLVFGIVYYIITLIPLPPPFRQIALVVMALIFLLVLLSWLLPFVGEPPLWGRPVLR